MTILSNKLICYLLLVSLLSDREEALRVQQQKLATHTLSSYAASLNKIQTLKGRISFQTDKVTGAEVVTSNQSQVEFAFDRGKRQARWSMRNSSSLPRSPDVSTKVINEMTKFLQVYRTEPFFEGSIHKHSSTVTISSLKDWYTDSKLQDFDLLFYMTAGMNSFRQSFRTTGGNTNFDIEDSAWQVEMKENGIIMTLDKNENGQRLEFNIDRNFGAQLMRRKSDNTQKTETWEYTYHVVNGVTLPKRVVLKQHDKTTKHTVSQILDWRELSVNQPLSEEEFTLAQLGVKAGDIVKDITGNVQYVATSQVHDQNKSTSYLTKAAEQEDHYVLYLMLNGLAWCIVFGVLAHLRTRSLTDQKPNDTNM